MDPGCAAKWAAGKRIATGLVLLAPLHSALPQSSADPIVWARERLLVLGMREIEATGRERSVRELSFIAAALGRSSSPQARELADRSTAALIAAQAADGGFGSGEARAAESWFALIALDSSSPGPAAEAGAGLRAFLASSAAKSDSRSRPADGETVSREELRRALEFLDRGADSAPGDGAGSWQEDESLATLFAAAGGPFDVRATLAALLRSPLAPTDDLALERVSGELHELLVRALILERFGNPRLSTPSGAALWWPERLAESVEAKVAVSMDEQSGQIVELASALLTLDVLRPWLDISPESLLQAEAGESRRPADLAQDCESCHQRLPPSLHELWARSAHASARVGCADCHGENHSLIFREEGRVSPAVCGGCHRRIAEEFARSRHSRAEEHLIESALFAATSEARRESCFACHRIGAKNSDGTSGSCNLCHAGHEFRAAQARTPEACTVCHVGEDYPQDLAYRNSVHGALWELTRDESVAPTCATCHHPNGNHDDGFGISLGCGGTGGCLEGAQSAVPMRVFAAEDAAARRAEMVGVCTSCHSSRFSEASLRDADRIKVEGDAMLAEGARILRGLHEEGLVGEPGGALLLGGDQLRSDPAVPGSALLDRFYRMWRFDQAWAFKGAYHSSPSVANRQSLPGLEEGLDYLRHHARLLREEDKR